MKLVVLVGPPGSGKSTVANSFVLNGFTRISQDDQGKEQHFNLFKEAIAAKKNIVVDRMNFNKVQRDRYLNFADGYETEIHVFHESYKTCLSRCDLRTDHPTIKSKEDAVKAITFFFNNYDRVQDHEAAKVIRHWPKGYKPKAIICDLDGTLCNVDHRLHWVRGEGKKNWPMFMADIPKDSVNEWCAEILSTAIDPIVYCSGRGEEVRQATEDWLEEHSIMPGQLFMRNKGNNRPDHVIKEIILDFEILTRYSINFIIDDRQQVVDMWRRRGFVCLQCAKGDF